MTPKLAYQISCQSVAVSRELGLTGRVFANQYRALSVTEGPEQILGNYFKAFENDVLVDTVVLHVQRSIETREFSDYSVWLNLPYDVMECPDVYKLNAQTVISALPDHPSPRLRIMMQAFLNDTLDAA